MARPARPRTAHRARRATVGVALATLLLGACSGTDPAPTAAPTSASSATDAGSSSTTTGSTVGTTAPAPTDLVAAACAGTLEVTSAGRVAAEAGEELSGIVASRQTPGVSWVHDDSGAGPEIYAIDEEGALLATYDLGVEATDWEDIAIGPRVDDDGWTLYVGDIGDNAEARPSVQLQAIVEPRIDRSASAPAGDEVVAFVGGQGTVTLTYPDRPHNAEALLVDPDTGQLVIITKELTGPAQIFVAENDQLAVGTSTVLTADGQVDFGDEGLSSWVTAADVSPDGSVVAVRTYGGVHLFAREPGRSIADALAGTPCEGPPPLEVQGEAIAISADGTSYLTVSEGAEPILHRTG